MWFFCWIYALVQSSTFPVSPDAYKVAVGVASPKTISAPKSALVVDSEAVESLRLLYKDNPASLDAAIQSSGIPTVSVREGEVVVRKGEIVSRQDFDVLGYFNLRETPGYTPPPSLIKEKVKSDSFAGCKAWWRNLIS